jgi:hypothetical protein
MKINTTMPIALKPFYRKEMLLAKNEFDKKNYQQSWRHLERAHILGQPYPLAHTAVHWKMLGFGIKIKSAKEVVGQIPRLLFGGVKSFVGKIPVGNTGGVNIPPFLPMAIPEDLLLIIRSNKQL